DGLNRFDGYTFTVFRHDPLNDRSLGDDYIDAIAEDSAHNLWVGTREGVYYYERSSGNFLSAEEKFGISSPFLHGFVTSLLIDTRGWCWFSTPAGVGILRPGDQEVDSLPEFNRKAASVVGMRTLCTDNAGDVWISSLNALFRYSEASRSLKPVPIPDSSGLNIGRAMSVLEDRSGMMWFGMLSGRLMAYDRNSGEWSVVPLRKSGPDSLNKDFV